MNKTIHFQHLGTMGYRQAWDIQEQLFNAIIQKKIANRKLLDAGQLPAETENHLIFCEHTPVFTLGKSGDMQHLLVSQEILNQKKISFFKTNRGGDITFHGPGQVVGYPILDLANFFTDIGKYMRSLEEVIILTLADYGITAGRSQGETGVWLDADDIFKARKICAMGVRTSHWVTMHGWALNVNADLSYFDMMIPCGIKGKAVTSMQKELGKQIEMAEVESKLRHHFTEVFSANMELEPESVHQ